MPSSPVRVALVGCGAVAELSYAPALRVLSAEGLLEVAALVEPNPESSRRLEATFPDARVHRDTTALSEGTVDLAIVASPPRFHAEQTIQLLREGVSVLCEKPMAATSLEAEAMIAASAAAKRVLAIGLVRRFLPAAQTVRALLAQGVLGDIQDFHFTEGGRFRWPTRSADYFRPGAANGGVLADIGTHLLDLIVWWLGEPMDVRYEDDAMGGVELNCRVELRFPKGFTGTVRLSRDCDLPSRCFIRGTRGWLLWSIHAPEHLTLHFEGTACVVSGRLHELPAGPSQPGAGRRVANFEQSFVEQLRNVVASVRGDARPFVGGQEALAAVRLVESCYRHRTLMPMGWLNEVEAARAGKLSREGSAR